LNNQAKPENQTQPQQQLAQAGKKKYRKYYYKKKRKSYSGHQENIQHEVINFQFKKISVIIPLFNEEESIRPLFIDLKKALRGISSDHEIIFIDDGSSDKSLHIIKDLAKTDNKIRYFSFRTNYGKSAALQVGFYNATGDVVVTMDSDLQDDPVEIANLLKKLEEGFDLVSGWKKKRFDPLIKRISSRFFNFVTRILTGIKIHDFNCGLKAYRKLVTESINVYGELHRYIPVLANWKGFSVSEVIVKHHPRRYGKTKYGLSRFFKGFIDLITVIFTTRYAKRPIHLFGFVGLLTAIAGLGISLWLTYEKLFYNIGINNRPIFFLGILLIIVGVQFFAIGLIGELIVHNTQSEKEYVIKEKK